MRLLSRFELAWTRVVMRLNVRVISVPFHARHQLSDVRAEVGHHIATSGNFNCEQADNLAATISVFVRESTGRESPQD